MVEEPLVLVVHVIVRLVVVGRERLDMDEGPVFLKIILEEHCSTCGRLHVVDLGILKLFL